MPACSARSSRHRGHKAVALWKTLGRSAPVRAVACFLAASYIWFVHKTSRWHTINREIPERFWADRKPFILAFWHGRILMVPYCWPRDIPGSILVSRNRDGSLIAGVIRYFGAETVRGSTARPGRESDKGAQAALMQILRKLKAGEYIGITPDGPRGPRMRASEGVAAMSRLSGVPVIPCAWSTKRRRVLSSWDRFILPLPFNRGVFVWGEPISVPPGAKGAEMDAARQTIEDGLNYVTREADRLAGHDPAAIRPAEVAEAA